MAGGSQQGKGILGSGKSRPNGPEESENMVLQSSPVVGVTRKQGDW